MDFACLLEEEGIADAIISEDCFFLLLHRPCKPPLIYTDKKLITLELQNLLASKHLPEILQGTSVRHGSLLKKHGLSSALVYEYSLQKLSPAKKQRFSHLLYGTKQVSSLLAAAAGTRLGRGSFRVPPQAKKQIESFLAEQNVPWEVTFSFFQEKKR